VLHAPGQLAVYPIVPLGLFGWTVGEYLRRLQRGMKKQHCGRRYQQEPI
jgi:lipoate-protein ligase B